MKAEEQTIQQLEWIVRKLTHKYPATDESSAITDIHFRLSQDSGELIIADDDDKELIRCVVAEWIDNKDEDFYSGVTRLLQHFLKEKADVVGNLGIMKPYSFVLEDDEKEHVAELFMADDDLVIIGDELMKDLDEDLDAFLEHLLQ